MILQMRVVFNSFAQIIAVFSAVANPGYLFFFDIVGTVLDAHNILNCSIVVINVVTFFKVSDGLARFVFVVPMQCHSQTELSVQLVA